MGPSKSAFASIELSFIVHGTEDETKLLRAVAETFSVKSDVFEKSIAKGYFGNPIVYYKAIIKADAAEATFNDVFSKLSTKDVKNLLRRLDRHVDRQGHLYLRIDKQNLLLDRWLTGSADPIRLKVKLSKWGANIYDWKQTISQFLQGKTDKSKSAATTSAR